MSNSNFDRNVGKSPVQPSHPAGTSPRDGEAFASLKALINPLTDIHANGAVDWSSVVILASEILAQEGKDLSVGAWLTVGLLETGGLPALCDGIHIMRDLVTIYWQDMSPAATRLRGRRNQIQWLLEHLTERLQASRHSYAELPADLHASMLEDWEALDAEWQCHDDQTPAFYRLRSTLRDLPVQTVPHTEQPAPAAQDRATAPAVNNSPPSSPSPNLAVAVIETSPMSATAVAPITGVDPEAAADAALAGLHPLLGWYLQTHPTMPLLIRLNRVCAWATLEQAPSDSGGITLLMPPPLQIVGSLEKIAQTGEPQAMVQFAESHLTMHRYWLDLNRASHAALTRMGAAAAAAVVGFETARLVDRLPGLLDLKFNDGQPFADAQTRAWLIAFTDGSSRGTASRDNVEDFQTLAAEAEAEAEAGRLGEALNRLQNATNRTEGLRMRFRLRLTQCMLLHRFDDRADIRAMMAPLIDELDAHCLQQWEPELARQALTLAAAIERRYNADDTGPSRSPLWARLAGLDCPAAWQLSQSTAAA